MKESPMTPKDPLKERNLLSDRLADSPYDLVLYLQRASTYLELCYPDLAAGDANKALLLTDEVLDDSGEYHEAAFEALSHYSHLSTEDSTSRAESIEELARSYALQSYQILTGALSQCGCNRSALGFCKRGLLAYPEDPVLLTTRTRIFREHQIKNNLSEDTVVDLEDVSESGAARREIYPWNQHEPDRLTPESLQYLNAQIQKVAPKCEVKAVGLPVISNPSILDISSLKIPEIGHITDPESEASENIQLGLFATKDIAPGEVFLTEVSHLTATNRVRDPFCDACSAPLPFLTDPASTAVPCPACDDTFFCSSACLDAAQDTYHGALCGLDVDIISAERSGSKYSPDTLYLLLLQRALAMAVCQEEHALDLNEVKYLWGDFSTSLSNPNHSLPFSFHHNIDGPLAILTKMDINIFDPPVKDLSEVWVLNTLYAKFRGTASAFLSPVSQKSETSAIHPMWCLANHDCDPNTAWDWTGGEIKFWARTPAQRAPGSVGEAGIKAGDEIKSHYCDIGMSVKDRQDWALGSLGGVCRCNRCIRESVGA